MGYKCENHTGFQRLRMNQECKTCQLSYLDQSHVDMIFQIKYIIKINFTNFFVLFFLTVDCIKL